MIRCLLDVNVLIALLDAGHAFHQRAHQWWAASSRAWASCPLTENGLVRIMSSTAYSKEDNFSVDDITARLSYFAEHTDHAFWIDDLTVRNTSRFQLSHLISSRHLTDVYLLALAVKNEGQLVTFDQHVPNHSVVGAEPRHLRVI
ncbi:MAG: PIN domain-containing protein [Akkermansiaceae bacterium]|nr:PIN domain-containing protein [Akkermansiaceae bacterium]